jgi:DNA-binding winged helix-turn-helix (wHTH) protein
MRYRFGQFVLDTDSSQLLDGDSPIHLGPGAFDVLSFLVSRRDRVASKTELLDSVWGDRDVSEPALTSRRSPTAGSSLSTRGTTCSGSTSRPGRRSSTP